MDSSIIHYQIKVKGRVQGVGYRAFALRTANLFSLKGYTKNMLDGSVFIEAEGPREVLDHFVKQCRQGPGWSHVNEVIVTEANLQFFTDFKIRY